ncbi:Factor arrest protein 11 [Thecaphora frezii]
MSGHDAGQQAQPQPQQPNQAQGLQAQGGGPLDSVSLGQLRNFVVFQKPKMRRYDFPTDADSDSIRNEIDEFYSYVEAPQTAENRAAWEEWCALPPHVRSGGVRGDAGPLAAEGTDDGQLAEGGGALGLGLGLESASSAEHASARRGSFQHRTESILGEWTTLPSSVRRRTFQSLLSTLEVRDPEARFRASRALLYLLQGAFADTSGPDHQLHWLLENARMVRSLGGLGEIYAACKIASWKHDWLSSLPDHIPSSEGDAASGPDGPAAAPLLTPEAKLEYLEEINLELALHFAQLYSLIEASRGDEEWGDELMSLDPPLPIFLFGLVASLREKSAKGYPVKKLLLLLWKSLLCTLGGVKDVERCKLLAREIEGLGPVEKEPPKRTVLKANPLDFQDFQQEISAKYPTFVPPPKQPDELPLDKLASAIAPIPARKPFGSSNDLQQIDPRTGQPFVPAAGQNGPSAAFPGTPAPSPPPSPKPNKQKYQTDQTRPFVFPYSRMVQGNRMVPNSIDEASRLFKENMHVSLELWQTWRIREQAIQEESGVGSAADGTRIGLGIPPGAKVGRRPEGLAGVGGVSSRLDAASSSQGSKSPTSTEAAFFASPQNSSFKVKGEATMEHLLEIEEEIETELAAVVHDHMLAALDNPRHTELLSKLQQKRADVRRLQRVDMLYRAILPQLQSSVIVLLKLLLATVTAINTNSAHAAAIADGTPIEDAPPPTLEDVDVARHREILTKAVSAILLLSLKWFKASHVMKFNYLSQVLVDSNALLLILKIFGLQEVAHAVKTKNEAETFCFFNYCYLNGGREARDARAEDSLLSRQNIIGPVTVNPGTTSPPPGRLTVAPDGTEIEVVSDYSWRNFFSSINFTRILQKLTKRKVHRILLLVQYKSSAILKRSLKVPHPGLELYVLKVIKSQIPFCGRKWRQSNMRVITSIYLNCRPDLRDEWLSGSDIEADVEDSLPQEQALRSLVKFYNATRFDQGKSGGWHPGSAAQGGHRRSISANMANAHLSDPNGGGEAGADASQLMSPGGRNGGMSFFESDVLPPLRRAHQSSAPGGYIPDDVVEGYLDTYEDVLGEVFGDNIYANESQNGNGNSGWSSGKWGLTQEGSSTAWARLGEILGDAESIGDGDSIGSMAGEGVAGSPRRDGQEELEDAAGEGERDPNRNDWEHLSPKEMRHLAAGTPGAPGSPLSGRHRRRSSASSGSSRSNSDSSPLRPVLEFGPELLTAEDDGIVVEDEEEELPKPLPNPQAGGIDEVSTLKSKVKPALLPRRNGVEGVVAVEADG